MKTTAAELSADRCTDSARAGASEVSNALLQAWDTPHGLPPFDRIRPEQVEPALRAAMQRHRDELRAIADHPAAADFDNTVAAFDRAGRKLALLSATFYTLTASATSAALQTVQRTMAAPMAAHHSAVYTDERLFKRLQSLADRVGDLDLDPESQRLLQRVHLDFVRAGALLAAPQRQRHAEVMQALATLTTRFAQNVLHDEAHWHLLLHDEADLAGVPAALRASLQQAARERGLSGHAVVLSRSVVMPFLASSERRDLREQVWRAWTGRGEHAGEHDNREVARDILRLRHEQAALHGKASYADHALTDTMAGTATAVQQLLDEVWPRALKAVERERQDLQQVMRQAGCTDPLEAWDWPYWAEQVRRLTYAVDDAEIKPYFALDRVVAAAFDCAGRLFGLCFTRRDDLPVYHPDVAAYEVTDAAGSVIGIFLQDNFSRPGKRSGAWMNALRWQHRNPVDDPGEAMARDAQPEQPEVPVILNNNNFARGAEGQPTLLSLDDARTLFHEFGHGLHGLLSNVRFNRLSGTQVLKDFVELPSQIFEHWIGEPEVLRLHARHFQTGEPMPDDLMQRLQRADRFNQGFETVRYAASAIIDLAVHALPDAEPPADLCAFETDLLRRAGLPAAVGQNHRLVHFQHLFAGASYAAGYYVYLWAEVLDADGYDAFAEAGSPFDPATALRLLTHIYSSGNSVEPQAAYAAFRGRAPTVTPLLHQRGLLEPADIS